MSKHKDYQTWKSRYTLLEEPTQEGGNGKVFFVSRDGKRFALKQLKLKTLYSDQEWANEKKQRFLLEIEIVKKYAPCISGILPIIDVSTEDYWYVMPVAKSLMEHINQQKSDIEEIAKFVLSLADVLVQLHEKGISHRDIKPANIYFYDGHACFSDFGLIGFSEQDVRYTKTDKGLGAIFTIAPEMKRNPKEADGKKADVFSLAKTLWMFLMNNELGFDGTYDRNDAAYSLSKSNLYRAEHLVELEALLRDATDNDPDRRPNMHDFRERLQKWLDIKSDIDACQNSEWQFLSNLLFGKYMIASASWISCETIANVLNEIGNLPVYNHMFLPGGGGRDFLNAKPATEKGCLYLYTDPSACYLVKPKVLYFEGFDSDFRWNYFMLELDELPPIESSSNHQLDEYLVEDFPNHYVSARYAQYWVYDYDLGERLPAEAKVVKRCLRGKFLITEKYGPYNGIRETYDARHNMCDRNEFRSYINILCQEVAKLKEEGYSEEKILSNIGENPFHTKQNENQSDFCQPQLKQPSPVEYVEKKLDDISLLSCLKFDVGITTKVKFSFYLNLEEYFSLGKLDHYNKTYTLCKDGYFHLKCKKENIYYVYQRKCGQIVYNDCKKALEKLIFDAGYDKKDVRIPDISIKLYCNGKPSHLFDEEEIRQLMRQADDRKDNILVIDEDGYAHILTNQFQTLWYPYRQEAWCAGNVYVGKYADLSDITGIYWEAMDGWRRYLKTGYQIYSENSVYYTAEQQDECLLEIKNNMEN